MSKDDAKLQKESLQKSAEQLKKMVKMDGSVQGAFILVPYKKKPFFFFGTGRTVNAAASKVSGALGYFEDQTGLVCGSAEYDSTEQMLRFGIEKIPGVSPKVKSPSKLAKQFKYIAKGGLRALKSASINVGSPSRPIESDDPEEAAVAGKKLSKRSLRKLEKVKLDERDQMEVTQYLEQTLFLMEKLLTVELPKPPAYSVLDEMVGLMFEEGEAEELERLSSQARARFSDPTELREQIKAVVKKDYGAASVWNEWTLAIRLMDAAGFKTLIRTDYHNELMERLEQMACSYTVAAAAVTGFGLGDYGHPLNHGYIVVEGLKKYQTIERGGIVSPPDRERRHSQTYPISFIRFGNMLGAGYAVGGGSLGSVVPWKQKEHTKWHFYRGYVSDCWSYIVDVLEMAGLSAPPIKRVEDEAKAAEWEEHSKTGRLLNFLGFIGDH